VIAEPAAATRSFDFAEQFFLNVSSLSRTSCRRTASVLMILLIIRLIPPFGNPASFVLQYQQCSRKPLFRCPIPCDTYRLLRTSVFLAFCGKARQKSRLDLLTGFAADEGEVATADCISHLGGSCTETRRLKARTLALRHIERNAHFREQIAASEARILTTSAY